MAARFLGRRAAGRTTALFYDG